MKIYNNKTNLIKTLVMPNDVVLDVGFWGQGVSVQDDNWVHNILQKQAAEVYGLDVEFDSSLLEQTHSYIKASAENYSIEKKFDIIFAGDLIEHLSNPGLFLECSKKHLKTGGKIIITTPNCFNLFNLTEKISKSEPTVNHDHTCYFNSRTLSQLLEKNGLRSEEISYLYTLGVKHKESWKKKILNYVYKLISLFTPKYIETLVIIAVLRE
jgi:2-polyprenyl-3-methyl-5-hydroxy-6-metoxy-1,4-benzoquinol methylase